MSTFIEHYTAHDDTPYGKGAWSGLIKSVTYVTTKGIMEFSKGEMPGKCVHSNTAYGVILRESPELPSRKPTFPGDHASMTMKGWSGRSDISSKLEEDIFSFDLFRRGKGPRPRGKEWTVGPFTWKPIKEREPSNGTRCLTPLKDGEFCNRLAEHEGECRPKKPFNYKRRKRINELLDAFAQIKTIR
jgi:hypothetical protein